MVNVFCPRHTTIKLPTRDHIQSFSLCLVHYAHYAVACLNTCSYHKRSPESHKACKFWCQIFYVSLEYIAERLLFLCTTRSLRPQQDVLSDSTVHKICCSVCQKSFAFSTICHSLGCGCGCCWQPYLLYFSWQHCTRFKLLVAFGI